MIWLGREGEVLRRLETKSDYLPGMAWSLDGRYLIRSTADSDSTPQILDPQSGELVAELSGHTNFSRTVTWSPDGARLATGSLDKTIRLWDAHSFQAGRVLTGHSEGVRGLRWLPDSRRLISGGEDKTLRAWDADTGRELWHRELPKEVSHQIGMSTNGDLVATGCGAVKNFESENRGPEIRLWSTEEGRELAVLEGHSGEVMQCAFKPNGTRLASVSRDGTLRIWDCSALLPSRIEVWPPTMQPAQRDYLARQAATVGRRPPVEPAAPEPWVPSGLPRPELDLGPSCLAELAVPRPGSGALPSLALSPDGRQLATGSGDGRVRLWDLTTGRELWQSAETQEDGIVTVAFSPDGGQIASAGDGNLVLLRDRASGRLLARLEGHTADVNDVAWSPDGQRLATASADSTVRLWDPGGHELNRLEGHEDIVYAVAWSPDGRWLVSGGDDKIARLWDPHSGRLLRRFEGHGDTIIGLAFAPDGRTLATATSGSDEKAIRLWDPHSGQLLHQWPSHSDCEDATGAIWSPDGRLAASMPLNRGDKTGLQPRVGIRIWEAANGRELACFPFPEKYALRLAWSPDGAFLATSHATEEEAGEYRDIFRLWDTRAFLAPPVRPPIRPPLRSGGTASDPASSTIPADLAALPGLLTTLARLGLCPPCPCCATWPISWPAGPPPRLAAAAGRAQGPAPAAPTALAAAQPHRPDRPAAARPAAGALAPAR